MAKRLRIAAQQNHSWAIYHIKSTPAKLVGIIDNAPDEQTAIEHAIKDYQVPPKRNAWLGTLRRGYGDRRALG